MCIILAACLGLFESRMAWRGVVRCVCVLGTNIIAKESTMARPHNANQIVFALSILTGIRCGVCVSVNRVRVLCFDLR